MKKDVSALVVRVPAAEPLVSAYREELDPAARDGMPAHVTVLYPFAPPDRLPSDLSTELRALYATITPFTLRFGQTASFPGVLYLVPEPEDPLLELIHATVQRFPEHPPYGGAFPDPVPHLTIAHTASAEEHVAVTRRFLADLARSGPIATRVTEVSLMMRTRGRWRLGHVVPLGGGG